MSLRYRLGSCSLFKRSTEETLTPKRVVFLSVEGSKTEVCYFNFIEKYREQLGIDNIVHVEVLRKYDTNSDPYSVLDLLEEYVRFRNDSMFTDKLMTLKLGTFDTKFINAYVADPSSVNQRSRRRFEAVLNEERIDLLYLKFLNSYRGDDDVFGIVIDRDSKSHPEKQLSDIINKCKNKEYKWYITNPCIEFWLLLHVSDVKIEYADSLDAILANDLDLQGNTHVSNLLYEKTNQRKSMQAKTFEKYYLPNIDKAITRARELAKPDNLIKELGSNIWELFDLLRSVDTSSSVSPAYGSNE